jgi:circadian clock protein KaiB
MSPALILSVRSRAAPAVSLRLYVGGTWPRAEEAKANLKRICAGLGGAAPTVEIVDVFRDPDRMAEDAIVVTPTLVRLWPKPMLRILGTLSDTARVRQALGIVAPAQAAPA